MKEIFLHEISLVSVAANQRARVTDVKVSRRARLLRAFATTRSKRRCACGPAGDRRGADGSWRRDGRGRCGDEAQFKRFAAELRAIIK
jgi:hypothetical protein